MDDLKAKLEAILFCCPSGISARKLATLLGIGSAGHVKAILQSIREDYESRSSGLELVEEDKLWRLGIKPEHGSLVKEAAKPDFDTAILETLAYIAWKGKIKQSKLVKSRSNKAYEHIKELSDRGFIEKSKSRSTYVIKPTKKFYDYFNVKENEVQPKALTSGDEDDQQE